MPEPDPSRPSEPADSARSSSSAREERAGAYRDAASREATAGTSERNPAPRSRGRRILGALVLILVWIALSLGAAAVVFTHSSRAIAVASHDAVIRPDFSGLATVHTGPVLPDLRVDSGSPIGVDVTLGKTSAPSTENLLQRYAALAAAPEGTEAAVTHAITDMARDALLRGAAIGAVPVLAWLLVGAQRRRTLVRSLPTPRGAVAGLLVVVIGVVVWSPWEGDDDELPSGLAWQPLGEFLGPDVPLPAEAQGVEVLSDTVSSETRTLIEDAVSSFNSEKTFYTDAVEKAADLDLHEPADDETVVALVSDRHDNISMDAVARAVADAGGATAVFDAGDDTSVGGNWEAFSLDSVTETFDDLPRWGVAGNHDYGTFVQDYLADQGWTMLDGDVVDGPADTRLLGVPDPRSSGIGPSRDAPGISFDEVRTDLADQLCQADEDDERVQTLLVHDANLGSEALDRGCVDLVVGGHVHVESGPKQVDGDNGEEGWTFTVGTTGGAAFAFALGNKIRRPAGLALITYAGSRPVGIQGITFQTNGRFDVDEYAELTY